MMKFNKIFQCFLAIALVLGSVAPFYFCITEVSSKNKYSQSISQIKAVTKLSKLFGEQIKVCDEVSNDLSGNSSDKNSHNKKACDCIFVNQKTKSFVQFKNPILFIYVSDIKFNFLKEVNFTSNSLSSVKSRSPPVFA